VESEAVLQNLIYSLAERVFAQSELLSKLAEKKPMTVFEQILEEMRRLHQSKSADYGSDEDPLANYTTSADFMGVEPWRGTFGRLMEKAQRVRTFIRKGKLVNEGIEESLKDIAVIAVLVLALYRREQAPPPDGPKGIFDDEDVIAAFENSRVALPPDPDATRDAALAMFAGYLTRAV
jgi:hypothetical protein